MDLKCKHCQRYIGKSHGTIIATLKCPNSSCKGETQFKIVEADVSKAFNFKFLEQPIAPKNRETTK